MKIYFVYSPEPEANNGFVVVAFNEEDAIYRVMGSFLKRYPELPLENLEAIDIDMEPTKYPGLRKYLFDSGVPWSNSRASWVGY